MNAKEITQKMDSGDLYGLMVGVVRLWLEKYHPDGRASVVVTFDRGGLGLQIPVTLSASPSSYAPAVAGRSLA